MSSETPWDEARRERSGETEGRERGAAEDAAAVPRTATDEETSRRPAGQSPADPS
jgi:hypothetical protein